MSFLQILCLIFVSFKLAGIIDWSWYWVISPLVLNVIGKKILKWLDKEG